MKRTKRRTRRGRGRMCSVAKAAAIASSPLLLLAAASPAQASNDGFFNYIRNPSDTTNGHLDWWFSSNPDYGYNLGESWRAGSGDGTTQDECKPNQGPIPQGTYDVREVFTANNPHGDGGDGSVNGRAIYLSDRVCYNGPERNALFIHSRETYWAPAHEDCGQNYSCFNWPSGYISQGCIKLNTADDRTYPNPPYNGYSDIGAAEWHYLNDVPYDTGFKGGRLSVYVGG